MTKLIRDGKVAVLVAAGQGQSWATLSTNRKQSAFAMFDKDLVAAVLREDAGDYASGGKTPAPDVNAISQRVAAAGFDFDTSGASGLIVCWIGQGAKFDVINDRGRENIDINDDGAFTA